jgi:hypothetical protein
MGWTTGIRFSAGAGIFTFATASRMAMETTQPPVLWVSGAVSPKIERPGLLAYHSPPSNVKVKNAWSYISLPPYVFVSWCGQRNICQLEVTLQSDVRFCTAYKLTGAWNHYSGTRGNDVAWVQYCVLNVGQTITNTDLQSYLSSKHCIWTRKCFHTRNETGQLLDLVPLWHHRASEREWFGGGGRKRYE